MRSKSTPARAAEHPPTQVESPTRFFAGWSPVRARSGCPFGWPGYAVLQHQLEWAFSRTAPFPRMIALDGQSALSPFRLERLNARLDALHRGVRVQASWFVYFIDADAVPAGELRQRLLAVLEAKDANP